MRGWRALIDGFLADYAWTLDGDKLEEWAELFVEDCRYTILPLENEKRDMKLALFVAENRAMLRDRIRSLRGANEFKFHFIRHVIGPARIVEESENEVRFEANFCVFESDLEGRSKIFGVGSYRDHLVRQDGLVRVKEKLVILDTFCVPSMLSTPL